MISRVADHCFWFGRYVERAECTARLLRVTDQVALDSGLPPRALWPPVVIVSGEQERFVEHHPEDGAIEDRAAVLDYLTWESDCPSSLIRSIDAARDNARAIRETISLEVWQSINGLWVWLHGSGRAAYADNHHDFYTRITREMTLIGGEIGSTMLHDSAFGFITIGTLIERSGQTARTLDVYYHALDRAKANEAESAVLLGALLRACAASEAFMKRFHGRVGAGAVGRFLLAEPELPRSVLFSLAGAATRLSVLRPDTSLPGALSAEMLATLVSRLAGAKDLQGPGQMHALLTAIVDGTGDLCVTLGEELFGYTPAPQAMSQEQ